MKIFGPVKGTLRRDIAIIHKYLMVEDTNTKQCWNESKFRSMIKKDFFLTVKFRTEKHEQTTQLL